MALTNEPHSGHEPVLDAGSETDRDGRGGARDHERSWLASVVIPVHNAADTLHLQLSALAIQECDDPFEVIVVLNRCTDDSAQVAQRFASSLHLKLLEADDKPSAAYARNAGAAASMAAVVLFCDADDQVGATWVRDMVQALERADFAGGRVIVDRDDLADWAYERFYRVLDGSCLSVHNQRIHYPISASLGCRREAFESVGGFDESFPGAAGEEVDFAIRLFRAGFTVGEAPTAELLYSPRRSFRSLMRQRRNYAYGSAQTTLRAGVPPPHPSDLAGLCRTPLVLVSLFTQGRQRNPAAFVCETLVRYYALDAARHAARSGSEMRYDETPGVVDFVVPVTTSTIGGRSFMARLDAAKRYASDPVEATTLGIMARLLREGDAVVDVGANIGLFAVCAALCVGDTGSVVALEPDPHARQLLAANLKRHEVAPRVRITPAAGSDQHGRPSTNQFDIDLATSPDAVTDRFRPRPVSATIDDDIVTLDSLITPPIDLIRIDSNGCELEVLSGADELLHGSPTMILIVELNPASQRAADCPPEALARSLMRDGRTAWAVEQERHGSFRQVRQLDDEVCAAIAKDATRYMNLISGPVEREHEIESAIREVLAQAGSSVRH